MSRHPGKSKALNNILASVRAFNLLREGKEGDARAILEGVFRELKDEDMDYLIFRLKDELKRDEEPKGEPGCMKW